MVLLSCLSIARVHLVHAMNAAQCQVAADLWTKPIGLNQPTGQLTTLTIDRHYYSARMLILILPSHGGLKAEST